MTKQEAIDEMLKGNKVTNDYFCNEEYIMYNEEKEIIDERGYIINEGFWRERNNSGWLNGWSLYNK